MSNPLCSIRFQDINSITDGSTIYLSHATINKNDIDYTVKHLYTRFIMFGEIIGMLIFENYCYITFTDPEIADNALQYIGWISFRNDYIRMKKARKVINVDDLCNFKEIPISDSKKEELRMIMRTGSNAKLRNLWEQVVRGFDKEKVDKKHYGICLICCINPINCLLLNCFCKFPNCCLSCMITIYMDCSMRCPYCMSFYDPFCLRNIEYTDTTPFNKIE